MLEILGWIVICIFATGVLLWVGRKMGEYGCAGKILTICQLYKLEKKKHYDVFFIQQIVPLPIEKMYASDTYLVNVGIMSTDAHVLSRAVYLNRLDFRQSTDIQWESLVNAKQMEFVSDTNRHVVSVRFWNKDSKLPIELYYSIGQ